MPNINKKLDIFKNNSIKNKTEIIEFLAIITTILYKIAAISHKIATKKKFKILYET